VVRRALLLAGVWTVGICASVALAFGAVAQVANGVAPNDVSQLSRTQIDDALAHGRSGLSGVASSSRQSSSTRSTPPDAETSAAPTTTLHPTSVTAGATTTSTEPAPGSTSTTIAPFFTGPPRSTAPPPTTATTVPAATTLTTSQGGTLFTRCSGPTTIVYVAAVPKTGYERTVDVEKPDGIHETFVNAKHQSTIEAECSSGTVHAQVEEESGD
jgi:hypothetical protein